jgi:drug/metabolite transporter (DMT)-like permease
VSSSLRPWLQIHFCVVLWGFTAILGKLISLPAMSIVWWRMMLVTAALIFVARVWRGIVSMSPRLIAVYAGIGIVVALHWLTFYESIKQSNASVAATCMALTPVFMAFVEPFVARRRFDVRELILGLAVLPGIWFVVGGTPNAMHGGIVIGAISAFLVAIFGALNKRYIEHGDTLAVTGIEMASGALLLTLAALVLPGGRSVFAMPPSQDAALLVALAIGCTLLPFALSLVALRKLSAFSTVLVVNLEPIYAIVLAILLLGEQRELHPTFYVGVAILVGVVFLHPWLQLRRAKAG